MIVGSLEADPLGLRTPALRPSPPRRRAEARERARHAVVPVAGLMPFYYRALVMDEA